MRVLFIFWFLSFTEPAILTPLTRKLNEKYDKNNKEWKDSFITKTQKNKKGFKMINILKLIINQNNIFRMEVNKKEV
jgi:hypothetical protein